MSISLAPASCSWDCSPRRSLMLSHGLCIGIGMGLIFCPALSLFPTYFSRKRSIAIGFVASGTTVGGTIVAAIFQTAVPQIGFGWTVRILAFITLAFQALGFVLARPRIPARKAGPLFELEASRELPYTLFTIAVSLQFWSIYPAYTHISDCAIKVIGLSQADSFNLLIALNGGGGLGRLLPPFTSD